MSAYCASPECGCESPHVHCAACGVANPNSSSLCAHHHGVFSDEWAVGNRIFCNLVHRRIEPPPVVLAVPAESAIVGGEDVAY